MISILIGSMSMAYAAQTVTLAWDPSSGSNIAGYRLRYGTSSGSYTQSIDVGKTTTATVSKLTAGKTFFFAVTAYSTAGLESPYSNQVSFTSTTTTSPNQAPVVSLVAPPVERTSLHRPPSR
jgi:hypothetical protein